MSHEGHAGDRRRIRRFIAAHLLAVTGVYGLALVIGGGFAAAPFPPDHPVVARSERVPMAAGQAAAIQAATVEDRWPQLADRHEVSPPWTYDTNGQAYMRLP
jgi:hypothetical protein